MCYAPSVDWPARMREGFALAAAAHGDRAAALAKPGLLPAVAQDACSVARTLSTAPRGERRAFVQAALDRRALPAIAPVGFSPRALSLLAPAAPRELGRSWLAAAPLPRPGFAPDPGLLALLHALAARAPGGR